MSIDVKSVPPRGSIHVNAKTSAANPTKMRGNPGMPIKPNRRSILSSQVMFASTLKNETSMSICSLNGHNGYKGHRICPPRSVVTVVPFVRGNLYLGLNDD